MTLCYSKTSLLILVSLKIYRFQPAVAEIDFVRGDFPEHLMKEVNAKKIVSVVRDNHDTDRYGLAPAKMGDYPWYKLVDFEDAPRFAHVGVLFACIPRLFFGHTCFPCTAFYVGDDLLMSAGHCIANSGYEFPVSGLYIFFPKLNGLTLATLTDDEIVRRARIVTSWWIPEDYYKDPTYMKCGKETHGHDFVFLRVNAPKEDHGKNMFYNLTPPDEFLGRKIKVIEVGYPVDVPVVLRPVRVETTLHATDDEEVKNAVPAIPAAELKTMKGTQVVLVARNRGISLGGASGSPLFPSPVKSNGALEVPAKNVIGIHAWSKKCKTKKSDPSSVIMEAFVSPLINAEIVAVQNLLRQGKEGEKKVKSVPAGPVKPVDCGCIIV